MTLRLASGVFGSWLKVIIRAKTRCTSGIERGTSPTAPQRESSLIGDPADAPGFGKAQVSGCSPLAQIQFGRHIAPSCEQLDDRLGCHERQQSC